MWAKSWQIDSGHGLFTASAPSKVPRIAKTTLHRLYCLDKGVRSLWCTEKDRLLPDLLAQIISFREDMYRICTSEACPGEEWGEAKLCHGTNPVCHCAFLAPAVCLVRRVRRYIPPHQSWWKTLRQGQRDPIREVLSPDGSALVSQFDAKLQCLVGKLSHACKGLGLTISLRKTYIMAQDAEASPPPTPINHY